MNQSRTTASIIALVGGVLLILGLVWATYRLAQNYTAGDGFFIQWMSIHSLVKNGDSPYSDWVTTQIEAEVKQQNSFSDSPPARYNSPLYSGIVVFPFALIDNRVIAHTLWLTAQVTAVVAIILIGMRLSDWKPPWYILTSFVFITLISFHAAIPWLDGGLSIWAALFLALTFMAIRNGWNEIGGIFLALSAIEPRMTILVIILTLFWAGFHRRRILIFWFFTVFILLSILGLFLVPNWIMEYIRLVYKFKDNFPAGSLGALFAYQWPGLGKQLGWLASIILTVLILTEGWLSLKRDFRHFYWTACLFIVTTQWIGIPTIPDNFIILLLPLILVAAMLAERWPRGGPWAVVLIALGLFVWEWALYMQNIASGGSGILLGLLVPMPFILLIGLYWVRWWAIKPKRMLIDNLRFAEIH